MEDIEIYRTAQEEEAEGEGEGDGDGEENKDASFDNNGAGTMIENNEGLQTFIDNKNTVNEN